jgi:hypothetical protein
LNSNLYFVMMFLGALQIIVFAWLMGVLFNSIRADPGSINIESCSQLHGTVLSNWTSQLMTLWYMVHIVILTTYIPWSYFYRKVVQLSQAEWANEPQERIDHQIWWWPAMNQKGSPIIA